MEAQSLSNSCVAMIVKDSATATASLSSDGSEQEPLHLAAAGQSPSAQVPRLLPMCVLVTCQFRIACSEVGTTAS